MRKLRWSVVGLVILVVGCGFLSPQSCVGSWGADITVEIEPGERLETATWRDDELWYLTRHLRPGESPERHILYQRKPGIGRAEGTVTFEERAP